MAPRGAFIDLRTVLRGNPVNRTVFYPDLS